jgi:ABC-type Na+ efflux pump permease subunit
MRPHGNLGAARHDDKGFSRADCGYRLGVAVATANRHPATSAFGWLAVNFAWFLATWAAVASLVAAAFMIGEGDHFTAPRSLEEILSVPVVLVVFAVMSAIAATVGLFLFAPAWIPGLALYLVALWWGGRALPSRLRRAAAVALSPLVAAFLSLRAAFSG